MVQMSRDQEITENLIAALIKNQETERERSILLQKYYDGEHSILDREAEDEHQPNNTLVNNFPGYIVDVCVGYFMGKPVAYNSLRDDVMKEIHGILEYNDEADENVELSKKAGIKGTAYELLYMDEEANIRFGVEDRENVILVYDNSVNPEPLFGIRNYSIVDPEDPTNAEKATWFIEIYTAETITSYTREGTRGNLVLSGTTTHFFGAVPIIEFPNNDERKGDFEKVLTLIDAYDLAQSNSANTFEYNDDAILKIVNMSGTNSEDITSMKRKKAILVEADGDVDWITKVENDTANENYKTRLQKDIHRFSNTPNLTDEAFAGNISGVALQFKLWGLEQNAAQKERKFKRALQKRLELIMNVLGIKGKDFDWRDINIVFTRNMPMNVPDIVNMVVALKGIISDKTLFSLLPFVEDPDEEIEKMEQSIDLDDIDLSDEEPEQETEESTEEDDMEIEEQ